MLTSRKSGNSSIPLLYYLNLNLKAKLPLFFKRIPFYNIRSLFFIYKLRSAVLVSVVNMSADLIFSQELIFYPDIAQKLHHTIYQRDRLVSTSESAI